MKAGSSSFAPRASFAPFWPAVFALALTCATPLAAAPTRVAVIDSGLDHTHPALRPWILRDAEGNAGIDFRERDSDPFEEALEPLTNPLQGPACDPNDGLACYLRQGVNALGYAIALIKPGSAGHGTHVTGILARHAQGFAQIIGVRVDYGSDDLFKQVAQGIDYAANRGARVINMSFGVYPSQLDPPGLASMERVRRAIIAHPEILFVIAAGNERADFDDPKVEKLFPASLGLTNTCVVGSLAPSGKVSSFSNRGTSTVDLYSRGEEILSTWPGRAYKRLSGSSMATPAVAGFAARLAAARGIRDGATLKKAVLASTATGPEGLPVLVD